MVVLRIMWLVIRILIKSDFSLGFWNMVWSKHFSFHFQKHKLWVIYLLYVQYFPEFLVGRNSLIRIIVILSFNCRLRLVF